MQQTLVYGATPSSSGVIALSTSQGVMSGYVPPLPGISIWNMPPLEDAIPQEPATIPPYWPHAGGTGWLGTALSRQAPVPQAPQMAPPIHQPLPFPRSRPATPYQQAVQPPDMPLGLGVTFDSSTPKPAPTGGQDTDVCRRQGTQGRDYNSQPASHSQGAWERSSIRKTSKQVPLQDGEHPSGVHHNVPPASTPGSTSPQCGGPNVANYRSQGWRKDLDHVLKAYYKYNFTSFKEVEWNKVRDKFFEHLIQDEWRSIKENDPLQ